MPTKEDFIKDGFIVEENKITENKLIKFLKENYPQVIKDNEIKLNELQEIIGLPTDEKLNGYGLNFIGRQVAKAIYKQQTDKVLKINNQFSKQFYTTQNMVIKGDNIDSLKILKNYYSGKIKCIYIDPPYNTDSEQFIYKDNFKKEELDVLGLSNISQEEYERLEFSFKTPKSHNGWLTFMYPRLKLAYDLLTDDGVIFISIDDNEQANLKLLCDDIFGEEKYHGLITWIKKTKPVNMGSAKYSLQSNVEYILVYGKQSQEKHDYLLPKTEEKEYPFKDENGNSYRLEKLEQRKNIGSMKRNMVYDLFGITPKENYRWQLSLKKRDVLLKQNRVVKQNNNIYIKKFKNEELVNSSLEPFWSHRLDTGTAEDAKEDLENLFQVDDIFQTVKPINLIQQLLIFSMNKNDIVLDFFAGSGTTGHAVMQLNAEDGGNRKFILCQLDEEIKEDKNKEAFDFCKENNFPSVISSITCERLNRAGEKIKQEFATKAKDLDVGYKVFDLVSGEKLTLEQEELKIENQNNLNPIDKIYNLIFKVGIDNPQMQPKEIIKDCMYLCDNENNKNYYIVNSKILDTTENKKIFKQAIDTGNIYIDGWTATINTTLQENKDNIKIIF